MDFTDFVKSAMENEKKVLIKSLSDTVKVLTDGENEFQLRLTMKDVELDKDVIKSIKNDKIVNYYIYSGFNEEYTGYIVYKLREKDSFYIAKINDNNVPVFEDYIFTLEENRAIFVSQPPDSTDTAKIFKGLKNIKILKIVLALIMPLILAVGLFFLANLLANLNCL